MTNILIIDSAATGPASISHRLTDRVADSLRRRHPAANIVRRDIGADPIPHLDGETTSAIRGGEAGTAAARAALALSDRLIAELKAADLSVIGAPMYN
ncbi:MAG: NAD(P)H-dependent oxidoreductase, partial [Gammaproteobacteria bacterium]